ncbi:3-galactosyl-N-acetylglucosaminide 4-alpha-L-fucosyltransferase FUT3-like [Dasypus novemcinctus]|uniref:3-galactosyl-N-acetylglucosaminide 4-alpha-L-fucosyltransferase FUT3-like n=1 Tax=Dasypus novemcinctus TaxID=9361 RepID=UPI00265D7CEE|nr:4-galactosyl-N-acetylglucosaminide 3-alpha-L-fucosyltransferase FUT5-like [Dasypus novemcinctus]
MDPADWAKRQCPWRHLLLGLLFQLLLALSFFSYLRVHRDVPAAFSKGSAGPAAPCPAAAGPPGPPPLVVLLWTRPFNIRVAPSLCPETRPGAATCLLTANRSAYARADAVIVHHHDIRHRPRALLPPAPRPPGQRWLWLSMESPSNCPHLEALDGYFNLTMTYRRDSDVFTPYGWLEPAPGWPADALARLSAKTRLVAWVVSNWRPSSDRVSYFQELRRHLPVHVYGRFHAPLPRAAMMAELARYKFYLAFENSLHRDYITEKLWRNALQAWAVPVVLGPGRDSYERFLPPDAFIHVADFASAEALAWHLRALDRNRTAYLRHFRWRETLRPRTFSWARAFCKACWRLRQESSYQVVPSIAAWFT